MLIQYRFALNFVLLVLFIFCIPMLSAGPVTGSPDLFRTVYLLAFSLLLLGLVFAVAGSPRALGVSSTLAVATIAVNLIGHFTASPGVEAVGDALSIAFLVFVAAVIVVLLFTSDRISLDTVAASLCAYLIIGLVWAQAYLLCEYVSPESFRLPDSVVQEVGGEAFGGDSNGYAIYFSFVTLTTLGYGDITPVGFGARMLASVEALFGQLYLTVLVARLVGLHISSSSQTGTGDQD